MSSITDLVRRVALRAAPRCAARRRDATGTPGSRLGSDRERGQVLVIFAFGIVGILAVAALVFDVGQNLFERRKQQDAADASALAGARWLVTPACKVSSTVATCPEAYAAAMGLAATHGYGATQTTVNIPPTRGAFAGLPGHIEVQISGNRGSYFAGVVGISSFRIAAAAVAANVRDYPLPYSLLSLNESACKAGHVAGNGVVLIEGDVAVASTCTSPGSLSFDGNNVIVNVNGECATAGEIDYGPSSTVACGTVAEHAVPMSDPLIGLAPPTIGGSIVPNPPAALRVTGAHAASNRPPNGCPGATTVSTASNPTGCTIQFNRDKVVWIYPGVYYGGLKLREVSSELTVYMAPGVYYMAGGGFEVSGDLIVKSVDAATGTDPYPTAFGGGVLIYNTDNPSTCASSGTGCIKAVDFQNTVGGEVRLGGYTGPTYAPMVIWQDRNASAQPALAMQGNTAMTLRGTIYLPKADFSYTGNGAGEVLEAQVICDEFTVSGNGTLTIAYDPADAVKVSGIGLVQ